MNDTKIASKAKAQLANFRNAPMLPGFAEFFELDYG